MEKTYDVCGHGYHMKNATHVMTVEKRRFLSDEIELLHPGYMRKWLKMTDDEPWHYQLDKLKVSSPYDRYVFRSGNDWLVVDTRIVRCTECRN